MQNCLPGFVVLSSTFSTTESSFLLTPEIPEGAHGYKVIPGLVFLMPVKTVIKFTEGEYS